MTVVDNVIGKVEEAPAVEWKVAATAPAMSASQLEKGSNASLLQLEKGILQRHENRTYLHVVAARGLDRRKVMLPVKF